MLAQNDHDGYAQQWLKKNLDRLKDISFEEITNIPEPHQRNVFALLPNATKAQIWKQKVDALLKETWTDEQAASIKGLYEFTVERIYTADGLKELWPKVINWGTPAEKIFSADVLSTIMTTLQLRLHGPLQANTCTCSAESWFSCRGCGGECQGSGSIFGCGAFMLFECNGWCRPVAQGTGN